MDEPESKTEQPEKEHRFDPELLKKGLRCDLDQYEMLKRCWYRKDITEWNEWRKEHPDEEVWLERSDLTDKYLKCALLNCGGSSEENGKTYFFKGQVHLKEAILMYADMEKANLLGAHLEKAWFNRANLKGTCLDETHLERTDFRGATFDSHTSFSGCFVDRNTDFRETNLETLRIKQSIKQLLEYNIRRMNWEEWYKEHPRLKLLVNPFWLMSDYGLSTGRIVVTFFVLAFIFAAIYANCAYWRPPGIVSNLEVEPHLPIWHYLLLLLFRPIYFSVVTMTTLGFGDMYANAKSVWGHILLSLQVILGYVLLGALITRFAVLFMAGGPAGDFADEKKKATEVTENSEKK